MALAYQAHRARAKQLLAQADNAGVLDLVSPHKVREKLAQELGEAGYDPSLVNRWVSDFKRKNHAA